MNNINWLPETCKVKHTIIKNKEDLENVASTITFGNLFGNTFTMRILSRNASNPTMLHVFPEGKEDYVTSLNNFKKNILKNN